jgi:two-component system chemotaxis response regulator CheB
MQSKLIKVLIVDDSALVREILSKGLALDKDLDIVGTASDPFSARDKIVELRPDVLTLDVEMPRMDGVEFLRRLMPQHPLPVVIVSALTKKGAQITLEAFEAGAVEVVTKPSSDVARGLSAMLIELRAKIKIAARTNVSAWKLNKKQADTIVKINREALAESTDKVIAIGASTGGTEAIRKILKSFPASMPGVVIVQHMPAGFTAHFANSLNNGCAMEVKEAVQGDRIMPGRVLVAPGGDMQFRVLRSGGIYIADLKPGEKVCGHCPSVEVMFESVAKYAGANAIGVILTGMGSDGAGGMLAMRVAGARTLAQDEESSIVFGMPKVAYERGGAEKLVPLSDMSARVIAMLEGRE